LFFERKYAVLGFPTVLCTKITMLYALLAPISSLPKLAPHIKTLSLWHNVWDCVIYFFYWAQIRCTSFPCKFAVPGEAKITGKRVWKHSNRRWRYEPFVLSCERYMQTVVRRHVPRTQKLIWTKLKFPNRKRTETSLQLLAFKV